MTFQIRGFSPRSQSSSAAGFTSIPTPVHTVLERLVIAAFASPGAGTNGNLMGSDAGWSTLARERLAGTTFAPELFVTEKAGAGWNGTAGDEGVSVFFNYTGGSTAATGHRTAVAFVAEDYDTEQGLHFLGSANSGLTAVESIEVPGGTTFADGAILIGVISTNVDIDDHAASGMTHEYGYLNTTGAAGGISLLTEVFTTAGATGARTFTWTGAARAVGMLFAIYPIPAPDEDVDFDAAPTIAPVEDGYELDVLLDGNDTVSAIALPVGSGTPSAADIHAGTDADDVAVPAGHFQAKVLTGGVAAKLNLTDIVRPTSDVYVAVDTNVVSFLAEERLPLPGYVFINVDLDGQPRPTDSVLHPDTADGNIRESSEVVLPPDVPINYGADGSWVLENVVDGRVYVDGREWDSAENEWLTHGDEEPGDFHRTYINNEAPEEILAIPDQEWTVDVEITPYLLDGVHFTDPEGDVLTYDLDLPAGLEVTRDEDGRNQITGTPTEEVTDYEVTGTVTDIVGDSTAITPFDVTTVESVLWTGLTQGVDDADTATAAVEGIGCVIILDFDQSDTVPQGKVIGTDPPGDTIVPVGSQIRVTISSGFDYSIVIDAINSNGQIVVNTEMTYLFIPGLSLETILSNIASGTPISGQTGTVTSNAAGRVVVFVNNNDEGELLLFKAGSTKQQDMLASYTVQPE